MGWGGVAWSREVGRGKGRWGVARGGGARQGEIAQIIAPVIAPVVSCFCGCDRASDGGGGDISDISPPPPSEARLKPNYDIDHFKRLHMRKA